MTMSKSNSEALSDSIREYIKDYIISNNLKAGDALPSEGEIALQLGVSRSPVREAVKALQSLGIVEARRGDGLYVREWNLDPMLETLDYGMRVSPRTLAELYQIRVWLEMSIIGDVVKQISDGDITELEIIILRWKRAIEVGEPYVEYDEAFHRVIIGAVENEALAKFFKTFWLAFAKFGEGQLMAHDPMVVLREHQDVLEAIKNRDPQRSRETLLKQFAGFQERIQKLLANSEGE